MRTMISGLLASVFFISFAAPAADEAWWDRFERVSTAGLTAVPESHHGDYFLNWIEDTADPDTVYGLAELYRDGFQRPTYVAVGGPDPDENRQWLALFAEAMAGYRAENFHLIVVGTDNSAEEVRSLLAGSEFDWQYVAMRG